MFRSLFLLSSNPWRYQSNNYRSSHMTLLGIIIWSVWHESQWKAIQVSARWHQNPPCPFLLCSTLYQPCIMALCSMTGCLVLNGWRNIFATAFDVLEGALVVSRKTWWLSPVYCSAPADGNVPSSYGDALSEIILGRSITRGVWQAQLVSSI